MQSAEAARPRRRTARRRARAGPARVPSSPNGPCSTGKTTSTSASAFDRAAGQAPVVRQPARHCRRLRAPMRRARSSSADLVAARAPSTTLARRGERDLVLARAAAREHATRVKASSSGWSSSRRGRRRRRRASWSSWSSWSCVVVVAAVVVGRRSSSAAARAADVIVTAVPLLRALPPARVLGQHESVLARVGHVLRDDRDVEARAAGAASPRRLLWSR